MADIGTLVVRMAADSAKMRTDLERVQKQLRETTSITGGLSSAFGRMGTVVPAHSYLRKRTLCQNDWSA